LPQSGDRDVCRAKHATNYGVSYYSSCGVICQLQASAAVDDPQQKKYPPDPNMDVCPSSGFLGFLILVMVPKADEWLDEEKDDNDSS
jgi:hypothetical protein